MKIFYSDVDDTIIGSKGATKELTDFLISFKEKKEIFVPCSGRPLFNMIAEFKKYDLEYVIGFNGAQIYDLKNEKIIYENIIEKDIAKEVVNELEDLNVDYILYHDNYIHTNNPDSKYAKVEEDICGTKIKLIKEIKDTPKILGLCDPVKANENVKKLQDKFPNLEILTSKPFFIEITPKNVTKGAAVLFLNNKLEVQLNNTYCFGDSNNDLSMFELDVNKYAVANARSNIKEIATDVILSVDDNGVVKFINMLYDEGIING